MGQSNMASQGTSITDSGGDTTFSATSAGNGIALEGISADGPGVLGTSTNGMGVVGTTLSTASNAAAVYGEVFTTHPGSLSAAVRGQNDGVGGNGVGVHGAHLGDGFGVFGTTIGGTGVFGQSATGAGVTITAGPHGSFTIHLSKTVKSKTKVAWLAVN